MTNARDLNIDDLKGMPDVDFDFGVSGDVKSAFRTAASKLEQQRGSRASWRSTGAADFKGHFSEIFKKNGTQQLNDLDDVASALRDVASQIETVEQDAREENQRRKTAREWAQRQADRSGFSKWIDDHITGGEDPPNVEISDSGPSKAAKTASPKSRETPQPGSGGSGGGGGTSSARPSDLHSFAHNTHNGDDTFSGTVSHLNSQCDNFDASCGWATLKAKHTAHGLKQWLDLNREDAKWAKVVADAFKAAGGEGQVSKLSNTSITQALKSANVAVNRSDIQVDPPIAYGQPPTTGYVDDPVNAASGNFIENESDLGFTGPAATLELSRTYNSLNAAVGGFGPGWSSWSDVGLSFTDEAARLRLSDGREIIFARLGDGWDRAEGENLWLSRRQADNGDAPGYTATGSNGMRWQFGGDGRLASAWSGPGTEIRFDYDPVGRLVGLRHEYGRSVRLVWDDGRDRIVSASASDGRQVRYEYDTAGRLIRAVTPAGVRNYRWNEADLIAAVVDADGVVEADNSYDEHGRVTVQRSPFGRATRFVYLPGGVTSVSDEDGTRSNTWITDRKGRLVGVIDADDHRQSTSYDRYGNPVMITERDGAVTVNSYDERGRRVGQVLPSGARISWSYDDQDRPTAVSVSSTDDHGQTVDATTHYSYEGDSRDPSRVIDPEGGVTLLTWTDGLLKRVVDPVGVTLLFDHDDHGELIATTDADGNVARLRRDDLGRVTAAITPLGNRTSYVYDGAGPLLSRQSPDGAIWRYEHTAGGRLSAIIDPTGGRTEIEHGDHGADARTIDPLGRSVGTGYDDLGNRTRAELPDGSVWEFGYDASSRLVETVDPAGGRWQLDYDVQGMISRTVDPTGVERTVERNSDGQPTRAGDRLDQTTAVYDRLGRTVAQAGPDGATEHFRYDLCGRLIEHVDPTGATTRIERDLAGLPVAITHPMGTTYRYEYDACGRRIATTDTDGSRYGFVFDADSRLVGEDWPTGEHTRISYDACGRITERFEPGQGTVRYGYDQAGRVTRISDGWHGRRRFSYDAAGQLATVTNAAGGVTRFEYNELGHCVATIDPLGGRTRRRFDAMGRVAAEIDPLGRTTRYGYDAAGRQTRRIDPSGTELTWSYDDTGRLDRTLAGDRLLSRVERDFVARTVTVREDQTVSRLTFDENDRLIRRTRGRDTDDGIAGAIGLSWSYDDDGRRTAFTRTDGTQTRYEYDRAGRVSAMDEPGLGRAVIDRDAIGRIVSMSADGLYASWTWDGGAIVRHEVTRDGVTESTEIERDQAGRVTAQITNGLRTRYGYDLAGQLVEARRNDGTVTSYQYDPAGRLAGEVTNGEVTSYSYDVAGQLLDVRTPGGVTEYAYDSVGRRRREAGPDGERRFGWDPRGYLSSITRISHQQDKVTASTQHLTVDGLGELAEVDGQSIAWDSASGMPALAQVGGVSISNYGPLTALLPPSATQGPEPVEGPGTGPSLGRGSQGPELVEGPGTQARSGWLNPDWRPRSTGEDPWGVANGAEPSGLPSGVQIGGQGNLLVDGMEWMQARVYDPASRGFLSTDPLEPVLGAGWAGNPYAFAGNDPLNQSDPWGLKPVTDKELQAYRDSNNGSLQNAASAATNWVKDNWEYIAAGALIVGGVAVMCTGIGGPVGAAMIGGALMSGGISAGTQKFQNGSVDWGKVGVDAAIGGIAGAAGGGAAVGAMRAAGKAGLNCMGKSIVTGVASGAADGGVNGGLSYAASGQPLTVGGFVDATARGATTGGVTGGLAGGAMSKVGAGACFVAGTQVLLGDGSAKNIEDVRVGDEVTAADPETGETHARRVIDTYVHEDVPTFEVETSAGAVTSTAEHPFYVQGKGWIPVRELEPGDRLVDPKGSDVEVVSVRATGETATVYNFNVDELHTYHVHTGRTWIRVHNECNYYRGARPGEEPSFASRPNDFKVDAETGFVRETHGVSVFDNPESVSTKGFTPHQIDQEAVPQELRIIQRGRDPHHHEIVPAPGANLTPDEYSYHLSRIKSNVGG